MSPSGLEAQLGRLLSRRAPSERAERGRTDTGPPARAGRRLYHLVCRLPTGVRTDGRDHTADRGRDALSEMLVSTLPAVAFSSFRPPASTFSTPPAGGLSAFGMVTAACFTTAFRPAGILAAWVRIARVRAWTLGCGWQP